MPFPTDKPSEIELEVPIRKPRRKRRRRRKRPRTSTHIYEEDVNHPVQYQEPIEPDYAEGYVRRRPMKRRRRPIQRRPLIEEGAAEENILPRRKIVRRPTDFSGNKTRTEDFKQWEPVTSTEEGKWKPIRTTTETTNTIPTTPKITTITTTTTTQKSTMIVLTHTTQIPIEDHAKNYQDVLSSKQSNSSRADMVVLHKRPINSNLPPTSAVIRRRLKPQNTTSEEITTTLKPKVMVVKEELPPSLLPPDFKISDNAPQKEPSNSTEDYQFNDEALTKMMKEQPDNKNVEFKFKSDSIPKVKDEILSLLKTKTGSSLLSNVLNLRNMSLEELLQHRERGSSQRHQELINAKEEPIDTNTDEPTIVRNNKNFTNYLIETKRLAQKDKGTTKTVEMNSPKLTTDHNDNLQNQTLTKFKPNNEKHFEEKEKNEVNEHELNIAQEVTIDDIKSSIPIQVSKEEINDQEDTSDSKSPEHTDDLNIAINIKKDTREDEINQYKLEQIFEEKKKVSYPTTTTFTSTEINNQENEATSFVSKTPRTRIVLETSEREPRLFDSMPDFSIKTTQRPLVTPTIPSQVLFIQDTNHIDHYQSYGDKNKDIDDDSNLEYSRSERKKLPVAVKSAIIASAAILAIAVLGFFVLLVSCKMRQKKRVVRKKSVLCNHNIHHDLDLRSSARSTSPVMDKHCHDYYDGYGGRIDPQTTSNRQYYLWRTLRRTFRYD